MMYVRNDITTTIYENLLFIDQVIIFQNLII